MTFLFISFVAGVLTVLAPCVLPVLPIVVGSSASTRRRATPYIVVASLAVSIILFTYLLKVSTALIGIPEAAWQTLSGVILLFFGMTLLFPALWERLPGIAALSIGSNKLIGEGYQKKSVTGDVLIGAALGPVFSSCSPTYFVILASVLPVSFLLGTTYLFAYVLGLSLVLLAIALLGQRFADRLGFLADPKSAFKRGIGAVFIVFGILIMTGYEAKLERTLLTSGFFDVTKVEQALLEKANKEPSAPEEPAATSTVPAAPTRAGTTGEERIVALHPNYHEIVDPSGFVNTGGKPITIGEFIGKKVILIDFLTYSCINCQRTFPYLNAWYEKYKDQGLEIIGIHTPEFAFEKNVNNVQKAMQSFGIDHPVVLDNNYATWNAYGNQYWPRKYLIDIHGNIVYDHIGEGAYEETEMKIRELLAERAKVLGEAASSTGTLAATEINPTPIKAASPETYFGAARNVYLENGRPGVVGAQSFTLPSSPSANMLYLGGSWDIAEEYATPAVGAAVLYRFVAQKVYLVAAASAPAALDVYQDGVYVKTVTIGESRLYTLIENAAAGEHTLELRARDGGLELYTFTFG